MKDFREFEELLASDECCNERTKIIEAAAESAREDENDASTFAAVVAMAVSRYELRKYHEWVRQAD